MTLSALLKPGGGTITLDGESLAGCSSTQIVQRGIVHVPEGRQLFPEMTVLDNLLMGAYSTRHMGRRERLAGLFHLPPLSGRSNGTPGRRTADGGDKPA
jgi:branched-chain amino acid transport system ATP-binding protein